MKKSMIALIVLALCASLFWVCASAANVSASLTGPTTVRAGDTITISFKLNGNNSSAFSGTLSYDSSLLELKGTPTVKISSWMIEFSDNTFVCYDNNLSTPIQGNTTVFTMSFKVSDKVATGTKITISCKDLLVTDGQADSKINDISYSVTIAPPMSKDNDLKSLTVSNATITPQFSADVTSYSASVPFDVSKLDVKAVAKDSKANVTVDSPELKAGGTTYVTITVKAENGDKKVYSICVTREQDPNYVPSGNNDLASITVDGFLLSPGFSADVFDYVIWLPYETESVTVSGIAADSLGSVQVVGGQDLKPGEDNVIQVICIAENGEQKIYTIVAKRAAAHGSEPTIPEPTDPVEPTDPSEPSVPVDPSEPSIPKETEPQGTEPVPGGDQKPTEGIPLLLVLMISCVCMAVGLGVGFVIGRKR